MVKDSRIFRQNVKEVNKYDFSPAFQEKSGHFSWDKNKKLYVPVLRKIK